MTPIRLAAAALLATTTSLSAMDAVTDVPLSLLPEADGAAGRANAAAAPVAASETDVAPPLQFAGPMPALDAWDLRQVMPRPGGAADAAPVLAGAAPAAIPAPSEEIPVAAEPRVSGSASDIMTEMAEADPSLDVTRGADGEVDGMVMLSDVLFDYAVSDLKPEALRTLASVASELSGVGTLEVIGHTDDVGSVAFNAALGQDRADSVRDWLVEGGHLDAAAVIAVSAGELEPLAPNNSAEARALNRRVAFRIVENDEG